MKIVVTLWSAEGGTHLSVGDDGPGIAEADHPTFRAALCRRAQSRCRRAAAASASPSCVISPSHGVRLLGDRRSEGAEFVVLCAGAHRRRDATDHDLIPDLDLAHQRRKRDIAGGGRDHPHEVITDGASCRR